MSQLKLFLALLKINAFLKMSRKWGRIRKARNPAVIKSETSICRCSLTSRWTIKESCGTLMGRETHNGSTKAPSSEPVDCSSLS